MTKSSYNKFKFSSEIASGETTFEGKCWNNMIQSFTLASCEKPYELGDTIFPNDIGDNTFMFTIINIKFKEIFSWRIGSQTESTCSSCYLEDIKTNSLTEKFIYSGSNKINSDSFFLAEADLNLESGSNLKSGLPAQYSSKGNDLNGFLTVQFSKNWFLGNDKFSTTASDKCYLS